jgi:alpha-methylacyl-CoA racemase
MNMVMADYLNFGQAYKREEPFLSGGLANYNIYKCKDEKYVALGTLEPKFWQGFCILINKPDWMGRMMPDPASVAALKNDLNDLFQTKTRDEWVAIAEKADICLSPVLDIDEVDKDEHIVHRNLIVEAEHPEYGTVRGINQPIKFTGTPTGVGWAAAKLGEDNDAMLAELGYGEEEIAALRDQKVVI